MKGIVSIPGGESGSADAIFASEVVATATPNKLLRLNTEGKLPADITGNAATATQATNATTADSAAKLTTARTVTLSGVTATAQSFNGTGNLTIPVTAVPASLITGGTMNGIVVAQSNTSYTTRQVRNIVMSTAAPSGGQNGDVWLQYT